MPAWPRATPFALIHNFLFASVGDATEDDQPFKGCGIILDPWKESAPKAYDDATTGNHDWNYRHGFGNNGTLFTPEGGTKPVSPTGPFDAKDPDHTGAKDPKDPTKPYKPPAPDNTWKPKN